jgi:hypothetical protein
MGFANFDAALLSATAGAIIDDGLGKITGCGQNAAVVAFAAMLQIRARS